MRTKAAKTNSTSCSNPMTDAGEASDELELELDLDEDKGGEDELDLVLESDDDAGEASDELELELDLG